MSESLLSAHAAAPFPLPWKAWSIPLDPSLMRHKLCGLLNKLTPRNFDRICAKIVDCAVAVERTGDPHILATLVSDTFKRGLADHVRCKLYASLCQRIIDELEGERNLWRKVDVYYIGNLVHSYDTDIRLFAHDEFHRILTTEDTSVLVHSMSFAGELLVHGVVLSEDIQDIVDALFDHAECNDEECTVALCRFLARLVSAFDAYRVLKSLHVVDKVESVLKKDTLSPRTRYLLMSMLEQVVFPRPHDAFSSTRERTEVYGVDLDDSDAGSIEGGEEEEMEDDRIRRTCSLCATAFLATHDDSEVHSLVEALRPPHRTLLVQEFIAAALHGNDTADAFTIGSMLSSIASRGLFDETGDFIAGIGVHLTWLADTSLDAPRAPRLMAHLLHGAELTLQNVEDMATRCIPSDCPMLTTLLTEMSILQDTPDGALDVQGSADVSDGRRKNRFERGPFMTSSN